MFSVVLNYEESSQVLTMEIIISAFSSIGLLDSGQQLSCLRLCSRLCIALLFLLPDVYSNNKVLFKGTRIKVMIFKKRIIS